MRKMFQQFKKNNKGMGVIEIILIIVVVIAMVILFHDQILNLINSIFTSINSNSTSFTSKYSV